MWKSLGETRNCVESMSKKWQCFQAISSFSQNLFASTYLIGISTIFSTYFLYKITL